MVATFITAVRTLTVIPIPGRETQNRSASLPWFPVIGALIGGMLYAIAQGSGIIWSEYPLIGGLVVTLTGVLLTGALHLDGIADVADGFGGGKTKERILEILKDSRHGTYGVAAVVFDIAARIVLIGWCLKEGHTELVLMAAVFSRTAMAWTCMLLPYARPGGGTAESFVSGRSPAAILMASAGIIAAQLWLFGIFPQVTLLLAASVPVELFLLYCLRKIGGITGDCIGAVNEIGEIGVIFAGCILYG